MSVVNFLIWAIVKECSFTIMQIQSSMNTAVHICELKDLCFCPTILKLITHYKKISSMFHSQLKPRVVLMVRKLLNDKDFFLFDLLLFTNSEYAQYFVCHFSHTKTVHIIWKSIALFTYEKHFGVCCDFNLESLNQMLKIVYTWKLNDHSLYGIFIPIFP